MSRTTSQRSTSQRSTSHPARRQGVRVGVAALLLGVVGLAACTPPPSNSGVPLGWIDPTFQHYLRNDPGVGWVLVRSIDDQAVLLDPQPEPQTPCCLGGGVSGQQWWAPNGSRFAIMVRENHEDFVRYTINFYSVPSGERIGDAHFLGGANSWGDPWPYFNPGTELSGVLFWAFDGSSATIRYPDGSTVSFAL